MQRTIPVSLPSPAAELPVSALARPAPMPLRRFLLVCVVGVFACIGWVIVRELITFERQAHLLASLAHDIGFRVEPGPSRTVQFPVTGETDGRLGYTRLPEVLPRLEAAGFEVVAQARWSPRLEWVVDRGLYAPYRRKFDPGLVVRDRLGGELHRGVDNSRSYPDITAIPPLVVNSLLFIENRELLDDRHPYRNPAVEWDRLAHSVTVKAMNLVGQDRKTPGASTLATQLEKYHHSPDGRTDSASEKLRQMISASLRAYLDGEDTVVTRQRIVTEYLNTVPLAAAPGFGEVHGLGNGLRAWFGADFDRVNALLANPGDPATALAYRQVLTLLIAQRRPSYYLLQDRAALDALTDAHLRLLAREGVIGSSLLEQALLARVEWRTPTPPVQRPFPERKWPYFVRARLTELMGVASLYDLDRWDLTVTTTVDGAVQRRVTDLLRSLHDPERVRELGLGEQGLLGNADPAAVIYSVTLMEHVDGANVIRVQADNADRPLDINRGVKLDLGSTAKLRTLVTYLQVIADLYERYAPLTAGERAAEERTDPLGRWVLERLRAEPAQSLLELLEAAMARSYSASPRRAFFTGGGRHVFGNFDDRDDHRTMSVTEAFNRSVNLVFIRMMADVVAAYQADLMPVRDGLQDSAARDAYLARFADQEGAEFLRRFHREYRGLTPEQVLDRVLERARPAPASVAAVLASVVPDATPALLRERLDARRVQSPGTDEALRGLLDRHGPEALSLPDRGFVSRVHPLELWLAAALYRDSDAALGTLLADSADTRQEVYGWLFKTRNRQAQDRRIATLLEQEAFLEIHELWQRLGYPFGSLVPSLATAIGSSADHPGALTELLGIIANGGYRYPTAFLTELEFATGTPYETRMRYRPAVPERVLAPEVAQVTRAALGSVVAQGTARRLGRLAPEWAPLVGGKTGTGDHRFERYGSNGQVLESRVMNRSAVFTFVIGERFFGTVTAFVPGPDAAGYRFTSALPVQVLGHLLPLFEPLLKSATPGESDCDSTACSGTRLASAAPVTVPAAPPRSRSG